MNIASLSIRRPVLATVFSIVLVLFGIIGFTYLGVREYPSVDPPIITVRTDYTGANAEVIESQITEPLEESINSAEGIETMSSISSDGRSSITVEFDLGVDLEAAANDVRDKVSRARRSLPPDADPPIVTKSDADAETILALTLKSQQRDLLNLTDIAINQVKERLQTIQGISNVDIWGEKLYSMKLMLDPRKMAGFEITPLDVRDALDRENVELPSGRIEGYATELTIRTFGRLVTEEQFNDLIITRRDGQLIRLSDVGEAQLRPQNERSLLRGDGALPMVGVAIKPQPGANYIEIVDEVYNRMERIKRDLPSDIEVGTAFDSTTTIRKGIKEVEETIFIAFGLVVIVIFLFLRDWRTTLIPVIAIPISLVATFFIMYVMEFSINILTLLGIVLATGLVVDDAIVVMENIYSKIEKGRDSRKAAHEGSKEIFFAIISTTITLAAVFLPIIFLQGLTGRLFREFGVVVAGAVLISAFVSLTLTPMMSSRFLKQRTNRSKFYHSTEKFFQSLNRRYRSTLESFLSKKWLALIVMVVSIGMILGIGSLLPSELAPREDKSQLRIFATAPEGTSYERMNSYMTELINLVDTLEQKRTLLSVTSPGFGSSVSINSGFVIVNLVDPARRDISQMSLADTVTKHLESYNFATQFVSQKETIGEGGFRGLPVQYVIQATSLQKLKEVLPEFTERARNNPAFSVVDLNLKFNKPELRVEIDREKAETMGVSVRDIAETLQLYFSGQRFGYFIKEGKQYYVIGQATRNHRDEPIDLKYATVRNMDGDIVPLENLVNVSFESSPPQLYRHNRYVSATVSAAPAPGRTVGEGIAAMDQIKADVLDESFSTALSGTSKDFAESSNSLLFAFILALVLIYLVLSGQFESFRDPLIIMFTVPLAMAGAILALWLGGHTLNIFSQIGMIVLIGIVTKNGILIVEFANQRKNAGRPLFDAVMDGATQRFRPILMTSMATILGALPIALALGEASTSRIPMGIAIIGGLAFSLVLTLYVIPALYLYISSSKPHQPQEE